MKTGIKNPKKNIREKRFLLVKESGIKTRQDMSGKVAKIVFQATCFLRKVFCFLIKRFWMKCFVVSENNIKLIAQILKEINFLSCLTFYLSFQVFRIIIV